MLRFETGRRYEMRSICNQECKWVFTIIARTDKTITIEGEDGKTKKCRINQQMSEWRRAETIAPLGMYSMCPLLSADRIAI